MSGQRSTPPESQALAKKVRDCLVVGPGDATDALAELVRRAEEADTLREERDRARERADSTAALNITLTQEREVAEAEAVELRARLREAEDACVLHPCLALAERAEAAEAERDKLREALDNIATGGWGSRAASWGYDVRQYGRAALDAASGKADK